MSGEKPFETIILNLDDTVVKQTKLINQLEPIVLDLAEQSDLYRYYCTHEEMLALRDKIIQASKTSKPKLIFYGSGDYHNLAHLGLSMLDKPVTVIHFDNHTDFWKFPLKKYHSFGNWVIWAFTLPNIKKVVQFGVDGDMNIKNGFLDIPVSTSTYSLDLLLNNKVETYPNSMNESVLWGRVRGEVKCVKFVPSGLKTKAIWTTLNNNDLDRLLDSIIETIPTDSVYFSIDKDTLLETENFAAYWNNQGTMTVERMLNIIERIGSSKSIIGVDICGDGSKAKDSKYCFKKFYIRFKDKGRPASDYYSKEYTEMNESVNIRIVDTLSKYVIDFNI